jgi:hypothetical protein
MQNIARHSDQTAGLYNKFFFTESANLPEQLPTDGVSILGDLQLPVPFNFFEATDFTPEFDQPDDDDVHGEFYGHSFSGFCAGDTPELAAAIMRMKGRRFVVLFQDLDERMKLIGDREFYLVFECKFNSGSKPGERKGYKFSFKGKSRNPALFYSGQIAVAASGVITPPVLGGAPVRLEDTAGNLITLIPAGKTLVISSGFKLTYTIK